jgi:NADH-quinone oxidoreductase subunit I
MYGLGILKSLSVTLRRLVMTYVDDLRYVGRRYRPENLPVRQGPRGEGIFTVQYPRERLPVPDRFRVLPFHVIDPETAKPRCTACGICAQVCPPQCIWIVTAVDPETGRSERKPAEFHIDASICMSCGFCAEFCPFDAIRMSQDFELAGYERDFLWDLERLSRQLSCDTKTQSTA